MTGTGTRPRLVLLVAEHDYFVSHRLPLALAAVREGFEVFALTRCPEQGAADPDPKVHVIDMPIRRGAGSLLADLRLLFLLVRHLRRLRPRILHNVSLKLALAGTLAGRLARVPVIVNAYTGLGYAFHGNDRGARLLRGLVAPLLRSAARAPHIWSVCQNPDDRDRLLARGLISAERTLLIEGSGVDTDVYRPHPEPAGEPVVMFVGRLLADKGIREFVAAAELVDGRGIRARFVAVGDLDEQNPGCIAPAELESWRGRGPVEWWGRRADMPGVYAMAHIVCLPTWHEGLPKVLLEAMATARPVVATRIPGCEAVVEHGRSGLLVTPRDVPGLAGALEQLIGDPALRSSMGAQGRNTVQEKFDVRLINRRFIELYRRLDGDAPSSGAGPAA